MEWVETTGRTIEEATEAALEELGVAEEDAEVLVLEEPRPGLFGRMRGEARVRARVRPATVRPKEDRRDRRRRRQGADRSSGGGRSSRQGAVATTGDDSAGDDSAGEDDADDEAPEAGAQGTGPGGDDTAGGPGNGARSAGSRSGRSRRGRGGSRGASANGGAGGGSRGAAGSTETGEGPDNGEWEEGVGEEDVPLEEQGAEASAFLAGLVDRMDLDADVSSAVLDEDNVEIRVEGDDLGILIGPRGTTLAALQELTRTVVQRRLGAHNGRLLVDVSGYRQKRKEALERFTREVADKVRSTGERMVLEPMSPADRKVVHDTINTIDGLSTASEGEEPRRRVVIVPQG